jgi:prepilin-type N-terminal cleavage/methylation domain-containing protein
MGRKINSRGNGRGFTLIELLVVVSIIALLVSILMPALGKARRQTRRVVCTAQMKQYGIATNEYAHNNNGYVPYLNSPAYPWVGWAEGPWPGDGPPLGHCLLMPYLGVDKGLIAKLKDPIPARYWASNTGDPDYYVSGYDIFICPAANTDTIRIATTPDGKCNQVWTHYVQYCGTTDSAYPGSNVILSKIKPFVPLYCDLIWAGGDIGDPAFSSGFHKDEKGLEGGNACFADGSADWRRAEMDMSINFHLIKPPDFWYWIPKSSR